MKTAISIFAVTAVIAATFADPAMAQDSGSTDPEVEKLQQQLRDRDQLMLELLERIEMLESRVGIQPGGGRKQEAAAPVAPLDAPSPSAPGVVIVDASMAERALERSLSREGALLLPAGRLEFEPGFYLSRFEDASPTFVETDDGLAIGENKLNVNSAIADFSFRLGLPASSQLEVGLPLRLTSFNTVTESNFSPVSSGGSSASGIGDLRLGIARTLLRERPGRPDLIGRLTWDSKTGSSAENGLISGSGFNELRASLTAIKRQDPIVFIGGVTYQHTFTEDAVKPGALYGANLGAAWALSPETSMRFALAGSWQDKTRAGGALLDGSGRTRASFLFGGSTLLKPGVLMNMSLGIGLTRDAEDVSLSVSFPLRFQNSLF